MVIEVEQLSSQTISFFENLRKLLRDIIEINRDYPERERYKKFIEDSFDLLLSHETNFQRSLERAVLIEVEEQGTHRKKDQFDLLHLEIEYLNEVYDFSREVTTLQKAESGIVVLDSIKELMSKLPKWLQRVISVISEALGIAKVFL